MATSLIQNALQVNFDSVLSFPDEVMVQMFKYLESKRVRGFLGCPSVLYEDDLVVFFAHSLVREKEVISCVQGKFVGIVEEQFAGAFGLPTEELTSMYEVPKDLIYDARSVFSTSGEQINWRKILFDILKDMVTPSSKQAKGFAAQICVLLKGAPNLTLGEAKTFPPLKILIVKTVGTYIAKNKSITSEEVKDEPPVEKIVKKAAAKRRSAPAAEPIVKRKCTTCSTTPSTKNKLVLHESDEEEIVEQGTDKKRTDVEQPIEEETVEEIVAKVIAKTAEIDMEEKRTIETAVEETAAQYIFERSVLPFPLPSALSPTEIVLLIKNWNHTFTAHMANQIKRHNFSSLTYENFPGGITDSACKNQLVVVSVQYGPFNPYIPIRSTTIGKSRVAIDPIAVRTSWRSNSDIASVTRSTIGYETPSSAYTRRPDEISADGFSSSSWPEQIPATQSGGGGGLFREEGGGDFSSRFRV
ncbi:hypothetical protein F511_09492 [Dorcoceras hygrometricum]|uniref:Uncharacterized protein n=1 Tax=Dorcoceras hygrometricum TaxID=472368 RepID=A0A2Z7BQD0_9LAMI|nr:hypothetical protein F511_09492 [Dorcoceras hygrometricum]